MMYMIKRIKWRIIRLMLEFAKRWGPTFLVVSVVLIGLVIQSAIYLKCLPVTIILLILAVIIFAIAIVMFIFDFKITHRKDYRDKHREPKIRWP